MLASQVTRSAAAALRAEKEKILAAWEERVRQFAPLKLSTDPVSLRDSLPDFLERLIDSLHLHPHAGENGRNEISQKHGRQRAEFPDYSLETALREYNALREVMFEILEKAGSLAPLARNLILDAISEGAANAASVFVAARNRERDLNEKVLRESQSDLDRLVRERTRKLAESEELFRSLVEGVKDYAIFSVDPDGYIQTWNKGAERMKRYTSTEAIGSHFSMLYPQDGNLRDEPMAHLRSAKIEGRFRGEGMRVRKTGEFFLADVLITPIYHDGELKGFSKVVADLTEVKRLIQERDLTQLHIEDLKLERTERERYVATLTHDLRGPLTAAKMSAQMILRYPEKRDGHFQLLNRVVENMNRADRMVTDLLDANRIRAGEKLSLVLEDCDLNRIARDVCDELTTIHGDRFRVHSDSEVKGYWSADALKRVLENLLTNAVKYGDGQAPVSLTLKTIESRAHIAVHNTGKAISPDDQSILFEPFHRTRDAVRGDKMGWGLGLTLVRGIADALGGMAKVESYPIEGTTFTIDIPCDSRSHGGKSEDRSSTPGA